MDWANEEYVRLYRRETDDDLLLSWEARALWHEMLKKFDRSGLIETRRGTRGLSAMVRLPIEVIERALPELIEDGRLNAIEGGYFAPNFLPAQEASKSDRQRQRESRQRRASQAFERSEPHDIVTKRDHLSREVDSGHDSSQHVTLPSADPDPALRSAGSRTHSNDGRTEPGSPDPEQQISVVERWRPGMAYDPQSPLHRGPLIELTYNRVAKARLDVAAELGLQPPLPMPPIGTGAQPIGWSDLRNRIVSEGAIAPQACEVIVDTAIANAKTSRSVEWLSDKLFTEGGWKHERNAPTSQVPHGQRTRGDPHRAEPAPRHIPIASNRKRAENT